MMKYLLLIALSLLCGCSLLNEYGIGGPPIVRCGPDGKAFLDDKLVGSIAVALSIDRKMEAADELCRLKLEQSKAVEAKMRAQRKPGLDDLGD